MTYAFVQGLKYGTLAQARGLAIHMAEGGGTVEYLRADTSPPARGVSVHFVCRYTGELVQMLRFTDTSGSINPRDLRTTDESYYGISHVKKVLGDGWADPNRYVISIEIEGFASKGPNPAQVTALRAWSADMRRQLPSLRGSLGHRDFQDYKGCPGTTAAIKQVFADSGGHGFWTQEAAPTGDAVPSFTVSHNTFVKVPKGGWLYDDMSLKSSPGNIQVDSERELSQVGGFGSPAVRIVEYDSPDGKVKDKAMYIHATKLVPGSTVVRNPVTTTTNCEEAVKTATAPLSAQIVTEQNRVVAIKKKVAALNADVADD